MKLRRSTLQQGDAPLAISLRRHERLHRIDRWIDVRPPWRHHANYRAQDGNFWGQKTHSSDLSDIRSGYMVGKDLAHDRFNLHAPIHWASIEAYDITSCVEESGETSGITPVP